MARAEGWLVRSYGDVALSTPTKNGQSELSTLKAIIKDVTRFQWWSARGPVHRWNEMILALMLPLCGQTFER